MPAFFKLILTYVNLNKTNGFKDLLLDLKSLVTYFKNIVKTEKSPLLS